VPYVFSAVLIGVAILVHELGHFLAAKWAGIPIRLFSIGFGPRLWGVRRGGTEYRISWVPVGGYVLPDISDEGDYLRIPAGKRLILAAGGPAASLALPVICWMALEGFTRGASAAGMLADPWIRLFASATQMISMIPALFSHPEHLSGVVGIVAQGGGMIGGSLLQGVQFLALVSLNLGVLNLLPIPALDGGKMLLCGLELLHPAARRLHFPLSVAGWVVVLGLMVYVTALDLVRLA
jgi:regulator of sigma E protease